MSTYRELIKKLVQDEHGGNDWVDLWEARGLAAEADAEIARLTAERDALKLDSERLDWCEKHLVEVGQDMSEQFRVVFLDENERDQRSARFPSLRQAIDAAIATSKGHP